jgi:hypothetical protein
MLAALVSRRVFILQLLNRELHLPEKYIRYITKVSDQAPHLELFLVRHGIDRDVMFVIAAFSRLPGSGLYAKEQNTSQHSRCINRRRVSRNCPQYIAVLCEVLPSWMGRTGLPPTLLRLPPEDHHFAAPRIMQRRDAIVFKNAIYK